MGLPPEAPNTRLDPVPFTTTTEAPEPSGGGEPTTIDAVTEGVPFQVDGDDLGDAHRLTFRHHPEVLLLVLP